ncbi:glycoside hydrolase family 15 protein [Demequina aurantiaca]|uniref:glycoside hydrolase family 15 protein n=1 Tax=Demequina aurantiaca TaxID=676200 RepID=UPI003D346A81
MPHVDRAAAERVLAASRDTISRLQDANGAYPASPTFSAYRGYCWFRDGSFIADAASVAGLPDSASAFFDWCAATLTSRAAAVTDIVARAKTSTPVDDLHMLPARFTFDGGVGVDDWWDFQLDGYGTYLWALFAHAARHDLPLEGHLAAIQLTVDYLVSSWDRPCYDWWEESSGHRHVSTLGCVGAGLEAAAASALLDPEREAAATLAAAQIRDLIEREGVVDGHLVKWLGGTSVDASLSALVSPLGYIPAQTDLARATVTAVESELARDHGVYRYLGDTFYGGGRWPLLSCFLGLAMHATGREDDAAEYLAWAARTATATLDMPEQVSDQLLAPERIQEWEDKWGAVATPLLWSHAMLLRLNAEVTHP